MKKNVIYQILMLLILAIGSLTTFMDIFSEIICREQLREKVEQDISEFSFKVIAGGYVYPHSSNLTGDIHFDVWLENIDVQILDYSEESIHANITWIVGIPSLYIVMQRFEIIQIGVSFYMFIAEKLDSGFAYIPPPNHRFSFYAEYSLSYPSELVI